MTFVAAIDATTATFALAVLVLIGGLVLAITALKTTTTDGTAQQAFAAVGVLFGLLAAGGLGGLFAGSVAEDAGKAGAAEVKEEVSEQVTELGEQVEGALEPAGGNPGDAEGKAGEGK